MHLCLKRCGPRLCGHGRGRERAGAAGIQIEDQVFPKKCGHFTGKDVIPVGEMVQKVKAAVDSRQNADFQIVARTDVRAVHGFEAALERAHTLHYGGRRRHLRRGTSRAR